jgi:hypothetical protein
MNKPMANATPNATPTFTAVDDGCSSSGAAISADLTSISMPRVKESTKAQAPRTTGRRINALFCDGEGDRFVSEEMSPSGLRTDRET